MIQNIAFGGFATALGLADDLNRGLIDRFRSLPMARSAVLAGRTIADIATNLLSLVIVVGRRPDRRLQLRRRRSPSILLGFLLVLMIGYAFSWVFAYIGLVSSSPEAANAFGFMAIFPLTFISSAFVPPESMPAVARGVRRGEPVHDVRRRAALALAGDAGGHGRVGRVRLDDRDHDRVRLISTAKYRRTVVK